MVLRGFSRYLSKMHFIKDDLIRVTYSPKPGDKCHSRYDEQGEFVIPFRRYP